MTVNNAGIYSGIDLAADPRRTGIAVVAWNGTGRAVLEEVRTNSGDDPDQDLIQIITQSVRAGIDCPLGWPVPFTEFLTRHQACDANGNRAASTVQDRRSLAFRTTDLAVHESMGFYPLSVSTNYIGATAMRAAHVQRLLGYPDRSGHSGPIVEVYPRASLTIWGLPATSYKNGDQGTNKREAIASGLSQWLDIGEHREALIRNDNLLDAVVCALTALCHDHGLTRPPHATQMSVARVEGWIALPTQAPPCT